MAQPTLDGIAIYPSNIAAEAPMIGADDLEAPDGSITRVIHGSGTKWRWELSFNRISAARKETLFTIAQSIRTRTCVFADEAGRTFTVLLGTGGYKSEIAVVSTTDMRYNVTIPLIEA